MTNVDDGRPSAELHPRWQATVFKSGHKLNCRFSRCKFLCFWQCEREHHPAAVTNKLTATSHLDVG